MTPDPYRKAYEKALEDLTLISERFEQLQARKKLVENLISVMQPIFSTQEHAAPETAATEIKTPHISQENPAETEGPAGAAESYSFLDVPAPLPASDGDPFQRRVSANFRFRGLSAQRSQ